MSKFFYVLNGKFYKFFKARPNNQHNKKVLEKIAYRLEKHRQTNPALFLTPLQENFIKMIKLKKFSQISKEADIAHNIPISILIDNMVYRLNDSNTTHDSNTVRQPVVDDAFIDEVISSDDELAHQEMKQSIKQLKSKEKTLEERMQLADNIVCRLNRASHNLMPGYKKTNRSVGKYRDPHLVIDEYNLFSETAKSRKISELVNKFLHKECLPKTKKKEDGTILHQSSSINPMPKQSWYKP